MIYLLKCYWVGAHCSPSFLTLCNYRRDGIAGNRINRIAVSTFRRSSATAWNWNTSGSLSPARQAKNQKRQGHCFGFSENCKNNQQTKISCAILAKHLIHICWDYTFSLTKKHWIRIKETAGILRISVETLIGWSKYTWNATIRASQLLILISTITLSSWLCTLSSCLFWGSVSPRTDQESDLNLSEPGVPTSDYSLPSCWYWSANADRQIIVDYRSLLPVLGVLILSDAYSIWCY